MGHKAWSLIERPRGKKLVQCKWVFQIKRGVNDEIRFKARLAAKGFTQDYFEIYLPVVRNSTIRILFALSVKLNLNIDHIDVNTAF